MKRRKERGREWGAFPRWKVFKRAAEERERRDKLTFLACTVEEQRRGQFSRSVLRAISHTEMRHFYDIFRT